MAARKITKRSKAKPRKTARRAVRKASRTSAVRKSVKKIEDFKETKSLEKSLSSSKDKTYSNTVSYLFRHLQKNIRLGQKKQARLVYDCIVDLIVKPAPKVPSEVQYNLMAHLDKLGRRVNIAKMRYFDTANHHCIHGKCKDHRSLTCRTFIENGNERGCQNRP